MAVYLFDTSAISDQCNVNSERHAKVMAFIQGLRESDYICTSCIAIAEILYGYEIHSSPDMDRKKIIMDSIDAYKKIFYIGKHTIEPYYRIRAGLFKKYGHIKLGRTKSGKLIKEKQPEELIGSTFAKSLGIQENDLWMVAIAVQYDLILVSGDKKMEKLLQVAKELYDYFSWKLICL